MRHGPPPDAFAVVMATGILAVAATAQRYRPFALVLFWIAAAAFVVLLGWVAVGAPGGARRLRQEARTPDVALRSFTFVAGATVLAAAVQQLFGGPGWAVELLAAAGFAVWLVLLPLAVSDVRARRLQELRDQVHGAWLLVSVGTSGLATAAADLAVRLHVRVLVAAAAALWILAVLLYLLLVALVIWRLTSEPLTPDEVTPDSWVLMGALAISALTGNHVQAALAAFGATPGAAAAHGLTVAAQIAAMAWIVPLLVAEVWTAGRIPGFLSYRGSWWAAVFPLGMFSAASAATARTWPLAPLTTLSLVMFWNALALWAIVAGGLLHQGADRLLRIRRAARPDLR
ncbi:tellurite resistance/C4-dicarboxylate transporter family protein [Pseudonocardia sp. RS11V-5]|uniref:tellurite resistance/C4-dicarboxylate transporter family protein n=1 Tax=Pseudonocardia terrae TaxID=2905831 RepID=UPI001E4AB753|nr:tellurite resistance/C4-dicarboxylate transporter family protein [Pseudonocardia terrae]MCE3553879.1 tellurite resistance/C4-dicarboxylate transporter family protein [Pseudonocardia terrae]